MLAQDLLKIWFSLGSGAFSCPRKADGRDPDPLWPESSPPPVPQGAHELAWVQGAGQGEGDEA